MYFCLNTLVLAEVSRLFIAMARTEKSMCSQKCFNLLCWHAKNTPTQGHKKAEKQSHDSIQKQFLCGSLRFLVYTLRNGNTMCRAVRCCGNAAPVGLKCHVCCGHLHRGQLNQMLNSGNFFREVRKQVQNEGS